MKTDDHVSDDIKLDVPDDSDAVHGVKTTGEVAQSALHAEGEENRFSFRALVRGASARIRSVSDELKSLTSWKSTPSSRYEPPNSAALHALTGLKFIRQTDGSAGWIDVEKSFHQLTASTNGLLPRSRFAECIGMGQESNEFGGKLFDALARRWEIKDDSINKAQLKQFWDQISDESFYSRLQTFFDMVDKDADGRITEEEVKEIITLSASTNNLSNIQKQADEYAALIMEALDPKNVGYVQVHKLEMVLLEASKQTTRGDSKNLSQLLSEQLRRPALENNPLIRCCQGTKYLLKDNWRRVWIIALWVGVMLGLFAYKFVQYRNRAAYQVMGHCVCMAKGAAETLKLNMALILLPVCRNTMTWLRNKTKLSVIVPFDDNLNFHMVVAVGVAVGTGIHVVYHMACDFPRLIHASSDRFALLEPYFKEQPSYWELVKGVEGVTGILMLVLMVIAFTLATPWLRRGKLTGFNAFWYSHHLFVIVYALLVVHGLYLYLSKEWYQKTTWMYLAVPVVLYALERLTRAFRSSIQPVSIVKAVDYPGRRGVLALHMQKPDKDFEYRSGQYMFVNCPAVSPFEWHPFSITSAPRDDYLSVHIQAVGDWTRQIKKVFSEASPSGKGDYSEGENRPNFPKVLIDGPYGAPAQEYKNYEVVMLVGLGIGATPMISIVKDILHNIKEMEEEENADMEGGNGAGGKYDNEFKTRRAYFYWMTREQDSFHWFEGVMDEVAELDHNEVIELHNHCTSVHEEGDARSALIAMIQDLNHAKKGYDVVSGTRVKSHFGKPNWRSVFKYIARKNPHTNVGVFYCGPPGPTKQLRELALGFSHETSTQFDFHKENF